MTIEYVKQYGMYRGYLPDYGYSVYCFTFDDALEELLEYLEEIEDD